MNRYRVRRSGEIAGVWRNAGELIAMTAEQAKHLTAPYGSELQLVAAEPPPAVPEAAKPAAGDGSLLHAWVEEGKQKALAIMTEAVGPELAEAGAVAADLKAQIDQAAADIAGAGPRKASRRRKASQ